jgi:homocysteine S-methyltransferase
MSLPQLTANRPFLTDGGLETTLVFHQGLDLPDFAAFPLLDSEDGRASLVDYYTPYLDLAERLGTGFVLDTPTWRANLDWGARLGFDAAGLAAVNQRAVEFVISLATSRPSVTAIVNGVIGPRGDGYKVGFTMSAAEAAAYHGLQARAFAAAGAEMISAITMTYADEAIGVARAAAAVGLPAVISFTVETDGRLPSGQDLGDAITQVDEVCDVPPAYYMVNCAHPTHFADQLEAGASWLARVRGVRANASVLSHAELDEAEELDRGDVEELGALYASLGSIIDLRVIGGCCGTDHEHVATIAAALDPARGRTSRAFEPFVVSEGDGPTIVLVHGGWTDHSTWALVVPHLSPAHRVVRYDRRGHSRSPWAEPVRRRQDEDDLAELIEGLGVPVHLIGNSYGASICLGLAGRRPELVASLAVHEPPLLGVARAGSPLQVQRHAVLDQLDQVAAEIRLGRAEEGAYRFVEEVALGPGAWAILPPAIRATMVANAHTLVGVLDDPDWGELTALVPPSVPLLLSDGSASPTWLRMVVDELATSAFPHAERLTFEGAGHVPHSTHPADYATALLRFVAATSLTKETVS